MTIILDFDDTLFDNAAGLKQTLARIFKKHGADFWEIYSKIRTAKGGYSPKKHLALLKKKNKESDIEGIKKDINKIDFKKFLFPGVIKFLKTFRKDNNLILLSWGEKSFNEKKIYGVGEKFVSLFDKIIIGTTEKAKVLDKILKIYKTKPVVFIDDKPQELKKIKDNFKDVILIKIDRSKGESLFKVWRASKIN